MFTSKPIYARSTPGFLVVGVALGMSRGAVSIWCRQTRGRIASNSDSSTTNDFGAVYSCFCVFAYFLLALDQCKAFWIYRRVSLLTLTSQVSTTTGWWRGHAQNTLTTQIRELDRPSRKTI
jgi:hypothetical protein